MPPLNHYHEKRNSQLNFSLNHRINHYWITSRSKLFITMAQQTAVDFIQENLNEFNWEQVFEQAKQMEKEQIINAFDNGKNAPPNYVGYGSQYFYETYEI